MSDVSKTNELIAEAQEHYSEMNGLNSRAAEVMMELVAALEAKTGVRVDMSSAVGVETQLATRVPVQGEPNDDREGLAKVLFGAENTRDWVGWELLTDVAREAYLEVAEIVLEAGFSRATVPDAATAAIERIRQAVSGHPECDRYEEGDVISCGWKSAYASVLAALDGAPEPEWEERLAACDKHGTHCWSCARITEHRRPAGPWLPVEGESND